VIWRHANLPVPSNAAIVVAWKEPALVDADTSYLRPTKGEKEESSKSVEHQSMLGRGNC
jgi:hypothetical protein